MDRLIILDNLRGIAFLYMIFQHLFYFYDVSTNYKTSYSSNDIVAASGVIARTLFILLAGYSVYMNYKKDNKIHLSKRVKRSLEILGHGLFITGLTYLLYPDNFVRFGILHFLALATLLISFIAPYKIITIIFFIASLIITYPKINPFIDTITGANISSPMMDWFPLNNWMPVILLGLITSQYTDLSMLDIPILKFDNFITDIGKNSLNLYTIHVTILLIFYKCVGIIF